jgi:N-acetylmuramoyl-L-alanine amidase
MTATSWYIAKVLLCSGILCGYYFLALRNKVFHRWNRFYLLSTVLLSLTLPFIKIPVLSPETGQGPVIQVLQAVTAGDNILIGADQAHSFQEHSNNVVGAVYLLVTLFFFFSLLYALTRIYRIRKSAPSILTNGIRFINTDAKGTPFSFFNSIFWNPAIDLHSDSGRQIFQHEIAHIREKHTYDKVFLHVVLLFFWINPFFWLIRRELNMIHEFIADKISMENGDTSAFAEMVLSSVYPGHRFSVFNHFFYSPLKRRLLMLTRNQNSKVSYVSRLLVLPLAALVFFAFTLKLKRADPDPVYEGKTLTIVIDAGHGGKDAGAISDVVQEKDLTLAIARQVQQLNTNKNLRLVLTRDQDRSMSVSDRVSYAIAQKADMFISIHTSGRESSDGYSGLFVLIPSNDNKYAAQSKLLGSSVIESFAPDFALPVAFDLHQRNNGIAILNNNPCPSVLIEAGSVNSRKDIGFLTQVRNQQLIAGNILKGIERYALQTRRTVEKAVPVTDTIPPIRYQNKTLSAIRYINPSDQVEVTYLDSTKETINQEEALKRGFIPPPQPPGIPAHYFKTNRLFVINGKISTKEKTDALDPREIKSVDVLSVNNAVEKYGEIGSSGAIEVVTKNDNEIISVHTDSVRINLPSVTASPVSQNFRITANTISIEGSPLHDDVLVRVDGKEVPADQILSIPKGDIRSVTILKGTSAGEIYGVRGMNGTIDIVTVRGRPLADTLIVSPGEGTRTVVRGNGITVQGMPATETTVSIAGEGAHPAIVPDKVFTKVEVEASFPGGPVAWNKYIARRLVESKDSFGENDYGTCVVRFIVGTDGSVSDATATTMKGSLLAKIAVETIKSGPRWIPASQNGHVVNAYRLQPVTLDRP